jgi:hypothetical protein
MTEFAIGRFRIRVMYRRVSSDEGVTLHIHGPTTSGDEEVLRFDCFQSQPHYHLGWSYRREPFTVIEATNPIEWAIDQLSTRFNDLLAAADALPLDDREMSDFHNALESIRDAANSAHPDA